MLALKGSVFSEIIRDFFLVLLGFSLSVSIRGFVKALAAKLSGDSTPQQDGFLTLNPVSHCDLTQIVPLVLIFVGISRIVSGSSFSSLLAIIAIAFLESSVYPMALDARSQRADLRIAMINLASIITGLLMFTLPIPFIVNMSLETAVYQPHFEVLRDLLSNIAAFSFIRLIIHLPPIPPREGFFVIRPFVSYKVERFLEKLSENVIMTILFSIVSVAILLPFLVTLLSLFMSTSATIFGQLQSGLNFLVEMFSGLLKSAVSFSGL